MYCAVCIKYYISAPFQIKSQSFAFPPQARKSLPIDRLEQLKAQLNSASQQQLIGQLEEVISKLEPLDSACSSRRSSISSHVSPKTGICKDARFQNENASSCCAQESFNVLDCGIYRVISRRGSQSDDDANSLANQSMLEEERLKEFNFTEEEQVENGETERDTEKTKDRFQT